MDGAGAQLFDIEAERRRRVIVQRLRRPAGGAELLPFTGVQIILPSLTVAHGQ